jgi:hypothetical protein
MCTELENTYKHNFLCEFYIYFQRLYKGIDVTLLAAVQLILSDTHLNKHLFLFPATPRAGDTRGISAIHGNCFERL